MRPTQDREYSQVPGLFRLWDLQLLLNRTDDFQVHYAHQTEDGTPLFAVYRCRQDVGGAST